MEPVQRRELVLIASSGQFFMGRLHEQSLARIEIYDPAGVMFTADSQGRLTGLQLVPLPIPTRVMNVHGSFHLFRAQDLDKAFAHNLNTNYEAFWSQVRTGIVLPAGGIKV